MKKNTLVFIISLFSLSCLHANLTGFAGKNLNGENASLKTDSKMIIVKEKSKPDTINMEYQRPIKIVTEDERREKILASLNSLSFTAAYKSLKDYERGLYLIKYLENKPNRNDIIKSFIDTTWAKEIDQIDYYNLFPDVELIISICTSKIIWEKSNKEEKIFFLDFLIEELMPLLLKKFKLLYSEWELNKKNWFEGVHEWKIDKISNFYADIFEDYKILEHGGHHPVKYGRYRGGIFFKHIVIDPEKFIDNLKILRKLIIEEK